MFEGRNTPFNDMGFGMGGGFGGGFDRFGSGMGMGMNFSGHDNHMHHHSTDIEHEKEFLQGFGNNGFLNGNKPKMEEPVKEKSES